MSKDFIETLKIVIDTREQKPYSFPCDTIRKKLDTGDYSINGLENHVTVERKSKNDAYGTAGKGRARFVRELERMLDMDFSAIIIESNMKSFMTAPKYSKLSPQSVVNSYLAWMVRYKVPVIWAPNRDFATSTTYALLRHYWKYYNLAGEV
jgi:ERCC4-type nuclease